MIPFVDGHNDTLLALRLAEDGVASFLDGRPDGQMDVERARLGGLAAAFFAVFVPPEGDDDPAAPPIPIRDPPYAEPLATPVDGDYARRWADELVALLAEVERASGGRVLVVRDVADVKRCLAGEALGAILHFEGAEPLDPELTTLPAYYELGLRSLGPVWSRPNAFATGVPFAAPGSPDTGPGLTDAGRRLVRECNRLGIMLDLSHLNEAGFRDVAALSEAPLVATHSNAHALCAMTRNLTDEQLDAIGASDGLVGVTVHSGMLREDGRIDARTPLARFLDHVDHVVERIGIDHVGFGSDFDGAVPIEEIADVSKLPLLADGLRSRGYGNAELRKFAHENWLRVLRSTWRR